MLALLDRKQVARDGSHRDNFGQCLKTLSAVESHAVVGFFLSCWFLSAQGLAYGFLGRTRHHPIIQKCFWRSFVKFMIINNFKQNIDETHSKQPKIYMNIHTTLWILKIARKNLRTKSLETFDKCLLFPKRKPYPRV